MISTPAAAELAWVDWGDAYAVYQPSSAETHVFNETTALILASLRRGPLSQEDVTDRVAEALGVEREELVSGDVRLALQRLEALGLVDGLDEAVPGP